MVVLLCFSPGDVLDGYTVVEVLPTEGEIQRYRVEADKQHAILYCRTLKNATEEQISAFAKRAHALITLPNLYLPRVQSLGYAQDRGVFWLRVEAPVGRSLREVLDEASEEPDEAARIALFGAVAKLLQWADERKFAHFGLTPSHIYVHDRADLRLDKVMGLGIRMVLDATPSWPGFDEHVYRAPEQVRREAADPRADIYALGMILYELLAWGPPYAVELAKAGITTPSSAPNSIVEPILEGVLPTSLCERASVDKEWDAFVFHLIAKLPALRPATWERVLNDFKSVAMRSLERDEAELRGEADSSGEDREDVGRTLQKLGAMPLSAFVELAAHLQPPSGSPP